MSQRDAAGHAAMRVLLGCVGALAAAACLPALPAVEAAVRDSDRDGLSNRFEKKRSFTSPRRADTDRDGLRDRFEVRTSRTSPRRRDTDGDGLSDRLELRRFRTNPLLFDTDGDGMGDGLEVTLGRNPLKPDPPVPPPPPPPPPPPDTTAPETTIGSGPSGTVASASASFSFSSSEPGSSFECRLDSGAWTACSSAQAYTALANGPHSFSVRARDTAGNTDPTPATRNWTVDVPSPPPPGDWVFCAWEAGRCQFTGTREVRYGANSTFTAPRALTNGVDCNNNVFGDPIVGFTKQCQVRDFADHSTQCSDGVDNADPEDTLADMNDPGCSGIQDNDESHTPPRCSNSQDDDGDGLVDLNDPGCVGPDDDSEADPAPVGDWTICARQEGARCAFRGGPYEVRIGHAASSQWSAPRQISPPGVTCWASELGVPDPASGQHKECQYRPFGPDGDQDSTRDQYDACPTAAGPDSHDGCPAPQQGSGPLPIAVWLQNPNRAVEYRNIGVNRYLGLWQWPGPNAAENRVALQQLKNAGLEVWPDWSQAGLSFVNANPDLASTVTGWLLGDEPDMAHAFETPAAVNQRVQAAEQADPARTKYLNFGFSYCAWPTKNAGVSEDGLYQYLQGLDAVSCDWYALSGSIDELGVESNAVWAYGAGLDHMERYSDGRAVYGFLEGGKLSQNKISPANIRRVVWNLIVSGADGINYFCHDFSSGFFVRDDSCLFENDNEAAIGEVNADIQRYADVLRSPERGGSASTNGQVPVKLRVHRHGNQTYVFAQGTGTRAVPLGQAQNATITIPGAGNGTVTVLDENRMLQMTDGKFTDHFGQYGHHVYRIG